MGSNKNILWHKTLREISFWTYNFILFFIFSIKHPTSNFHLHSNSHLQLLLSQLPTSSVTVAVILTSNVIATISPTSNATAAAVLYLHRLSKRILFQKNSKFGIQKLYFEFQNLKYKNYNLKYKNCIQNCKTQNKMYFLICVSSLRRGHLNIRYIVPIL